MACGHIENKKGLLHNTAVPATGELSSVECQHTLINMLSSLMGTARVVSGIERAIPRLVITE